MKIMALDWILDNGELAFYNLAGLVRFPMLFPGELGGCLNMLRLCYQVAVLRSNVGLPFLFGREM